MFVIFLLVLSCSNKYLPPNTILLKKKELYIDKNYHIVVSWRSYLHFNKKTNTKDDSLVVSKLDDGNNNNVILSNLSLEQAKKYMNWRFNIVNQDNRNPFDSLNFKSYCNPKSYKKNWEAYDKFDPKREKYFVFSLPPIEIAKTWKQPKELSGVYVEGDSVFYWNPNVKDNRIGLRSVARIVTK